MTWKATNHFLTEKSHQFNDGQTFRNIAHAFCALKMNAAFALIIPCALHMVCASRCTLASLGAV